MQDNAGISSHIITVGNEVLSGRVLDRNSHWISGMLSKKGFEITHRSAVKDDLDAISKEIKHSLKSFPSLLIITGGLGPTFDDKTSEALSLALKRKHAIHKDALAQVRKSYRKFFEAGAVSSKALTPERKKMAFMPLGGIPLPNNVGTAPGIFIRQRKTTIILLPGVPKEMKDIMVNSVLPLLNENTSGAVLVEKTIFTLFRDESKLAPLIERAMRKIPRVYIKSSPDKFSKDTKIKVTISAKASDKKSASLLIEKAVELLKL